MVPGFTFRADASSSYLQLSKVLRLGYLGHLLGLFDLIEFDGQLFDPLVCLFESLFDPLTLRDIQYVQQFTCQTTAPIQ